LANGPFGRFRICGLTNDLSDKPGHLLMGPLEPADAQMWMKRMIIYVRAELRHLLGETSLQLAQRSEVTRESDPDNARGTAIGKATESVEPQFEWSNALASLLESGDEIFHGRSRDVSKKFQGQMYLFGMGPMHHMTRQSAVK